MTEPFGFLEIKCPYTHHNVTPIEATLTAGFCSTKEVSADATVQLRLRENHSYFAQVQGQMAIGGRKWCDFVLFTTKGISVERIAFNEDYWEKTLLPKLTDFYDYCLGPEIVSPIRVLGLLMRNLASHTSTNDKN